MEATGPKILIDEEKVKGHIEDMARKARSSGAAFHPHFKTHRSHSIGHWFRDEGVDGITLPSLSMARYFLKDGWREQTVAFPMDPDSLDVAKELATEGRFRFIISEGTPVERIDRELSIELDIMIEIDTGDLRTGFDPQRPERIDEALEALEKSEKLRFQGFMTHSGNSYQARGEEGIRAVHDRAMSSIRLLKERYASHRPLISIGDTPTASVAEDLSEVDELRPGNFVFFDLMQERIGSCSMDDIACCLSCPVVAKHPDRKELIVHGGALHFSLDRLYMEDGTPYFGLPVRWEGRGWGEPYEGSWMRRLSQEHGVIKASDDLFREMEVGDRVGVLPVHSCLCGDAMPSYELLDGSRIEKFRE